MTEWHCHIDGQQHGPVSEQVLREWIQQGRLRPTDQVWCEGMADWAPAGTVGEFFPPRTTAPRVLKPHRGGTVLALGILGLVVCFICGIAAWSMGNDDLRKMDAGIMDPAGRGLVEAGRVCGMVSVIVGVVGLIVLLLVLVAEVAS